MLKKEYEILKSFIDKPWQKLTFKQIEISSKKRSKSYVFNTLKKFSKEGIIKEENVSNIILYSINFDSIKALSYFGFIYEYINLNKKNIPINLEKITSKIPTNFYVLIVTGSYAKNEQRKDSDLDLAIICDNSLNPKNIYSELRYDCEMNIPLIHLYVFKQEQFLKMLLDKKQNYGKEISKNNLILFGGKEYLIIIREAIKNGFNG